MPRRSIRPICCACERGRAGSVPVAHPLRNDTLRLMRGAFPAGVAAAVCLLWAAEPRAALLDPNDPFWQQKAPAVFRIEVTTSEGAFTIESRREWAPNGVDRLYNLARA